MKLGSLAAISLALAAAVPVSGQTVQLDEGTFRVLVGGREVGMETFSIRRNGEGADAVIIAQGRVVLSNGGDEVIANVQFAGAGLRPVAYDLELRGGDARRIRGSVTGSRAAARTVSPTGETMREFLVTDGAVILDDGVAHHYYFIAQRAGAGATSAPIMVPRESRQVQATITASGPENVSAGGTTTSARRLTVQPAGGDARQVWIDAQGRVLRVEIPSRSYVAVRTTLP
ncbi:MAG TPA: hypothetical protein VK936_01900 [Longimicrobiales bacterium]|nr:hypothetical protein [Longimicrobiales bacterium]